MLPFYYLQDEYENFNEFLGWYIFLIKQFGLKVQETDSDILKSLKSIVTLLQVQNNFNRLIYASSVLLKSFENKEKEINYPYAAMQISKMYLENIFDVKNK